MCRVLEVSKSGYYAYKSRPVSAGRISNDALLIDIRRVHLEHKQRVGSPRIWRELRNAGRRCSKNRIAHLMREAGIRARGKRKFRATTDSRHTRAVWPNVLAREFKVAAPDRAYVSDIPYIWTQEGWLYLATVLDLYSRMVVGSRMGSRITDDLTCGALSQAILRRNPGAGLIVHSDRGSQYASDAFKGVLSRHEFVGSMSRKGDCWDNAVAESFFHTLKVELVHGKIYRTREEAMREIFEYIEVYYNRKRMHSTLGYMSPYEYERQRALTLQTVH